MAYHYILTRFNLYLWRKDKNGDTFDRRTWVDERIALFEQYTLPSLAAQTCQDFTWILLLTEDEGETRMHDKVAEWQQTCPQIMPVWVPKEHGRYFTQYFKNAVNKDIEAYLSQTDLTILTTYLDNDDVIANDYVATVQKMSARLNGNCFISFDYGVQYFTQLGIATRICYPNNHFMTYVERPQEDGKIMTCFGYGSHFLLEEKNLARVSHVKHKDHLMWMEVIHQDNVDNDVKMTFDTRLITDRPAYWGCSLQWSDSPGKSFICQWMPRAVRQVIRRVRNKFVK